MTDLNLCLGGPLTHQVFVERVTALALKDYADGHKEGYRSGRELCNMFCTEWRRGHVRMASGLYNKLIWSLTVAKEKGANQ